MYMLVVSKHSLAARRKESPAQLQSATVSFFFFFFFFFYGCQGCGGTGPVQLPHDSVFSFLLCVSPNFFKKKKKKKTRLCKNTNTFNWRKRSGLVCQLRRNTWLSRLIMLPTSFPSLSGKRFVRFFWRDISRALIHCCYYYSSSVSFTLVRYLPKGTDRRAEQKR